MDKDQLQKKLLETFKIEADEHFRSITAGLIELEKNTDAAGCARIIETLHREAHSLKGASRVVNNLDLELLCQALEKIFSAWKKNELKTTAEQFDVIYQALDVVNQALTKADKGDISLDKHKLSDVVSRINSMLCACAPASDGKPASDAAAPPPQHDEPVTPLTTKGGVKTAQTVRLASSRLDSLLLKTEEMLILKIIMRKYLDEITRLITSIYSWKQEWNRIQPNSKQQPPEAMLAAGYGYMQNLEDSLASLRSRFHADSRQFTAIIDGLHNDAKELVMLPFSVLLDSFPLMVRNLAHEQGKSIRLVLEGSEIEIDKRILDELKDPLIHLVRNSIDHGIERPDKRQGKPVEAVLKITVSQHNANEVEILVRDDGCGINIAALKASAVRQGLLAANMAESISDEQALSLVFLSGVSTSPVITNLSGQGLGMTIVHEKIEQMGGRIQIKSRPNEGTEIQIVLPLSMTTFQGVVIKSGGQTFILPTTHLERIVRICPQDIRTVENRETIMLDTATIPLLKLNEVLGIKDTMEPGQTYLTAAVIRIGEQRIAFLADEILSEQEVLVKKLGKPLNRVRHIAAATILETGVPAPILNANDLIKAVISNAIPIRSAAPDAGRETTVMKTILVADDSITTRMLLRNILEMVGYHVVTAVDGADAWRILNEKDIALVVSDVDMPGMTGFELTTIIRKDEKLAKLPVILVTTLESPEDRLHGIEAGCNAYVNKSTFDQQNLLDIIKRLTST